jgi:hypothetical protein
MATVQFVTIPDELNGTAQRAAHALRQVGFRISIEKRELASPATPTMCATRGSEKRYILVRGRLKLDEIETWVRYCQSHTRDTRLAICLPNSKTLSTGALRKLRELGVGLYTDNEEIVTNVLTERDLAFRVSLPPRQNIKPKVRGVLGPALDQFETGDWRYGFQQTYTIFEEKCRHYLVRNARMGRATYRTGSRTHTPDKNQVLKMTMGQLKVVFCGLIRQNQIEANICAALTQINPIRIKQTHKRSDRHTETKLRNAAGQHMWIMINTLTDML